MRTLLAIALFLICGNYVHAQIGVTATVRDPQRKQKPVVIAGKVTDVNGEPIKEALVKIDQQQVGTDEHGQFFITVSKLPVEILVIHFVHDPYESLIVKPATYSDTLQYAVTMSEKHQDLDEVTISASNISLAYDLPNTHIIDFDLRPEGMYLLVEERHNYYLRAIDNHNQTLFDLPIRHHPEKMVTDCFDNTHIVYDDSVYQIAAWRSDSLSLFEGVSHHKFSLTMGPCAAGMEGVVVMQAYGPYHQSVTYLLHNSKSGKHLTMYKVNDLASLAYVNDYVEEQALHAKENPMWESYINRADLLREAQKKNVVAKYFYTRPVYAPVITFRDSFIVFNHNVDSAAVFDQNGKLAREYAITHHYTHGWNYEVVADEEQTRLFAKCSRDGMAHLVQFSPESGKVEREIRLNEHIYPWHIQVKGSYVYYLYHHYGDFSINYIYRQRID